MFTHIIEGVGVLFIGKDNINRSFSPLHQRALTRGAYRCPFAQSRTQQMLRKRVNALAFGVLLLVVVPIVLLRHTLFPRKPAQFPKTKLGEENFDWDSAPRFDLVCRAYSGGIKTFWNVFFPTYLVSDTSPILLACYLLFDKSKD